MEPGAGGDERVDQVGHAGRVVELDGRRPVAVVAADERERRRGVEHVGVLGVDQRPGRRPERVAQLVGRAGDERVPAVQHDDLVGQPLGLEQEVRAHEDGLAVLGHLVDEAEHRARRLGVEARSRLVEQQEIGLVQHRARQRQPGTHPGRVAADA